MVWNVDVLLALAAGVVAGAGILFLLLRRAGSADRERAELLATELEETREELESHREEVAKHFGQTSELFRDLTDQYSRLYAHLAEGAREFATDAVPSLAAGFEKPLLADLDASAQSAGDSEESLAHHAGEDERLEVEEDELPAAGAPAEDLPSKANGGSHPAAV